MRPFPVRPGSGRRWRAGQSPIVTALFADIVDYSRLVSELDSEDVADARLLLGKDSGSWKLKQCPLGEGMVDWARFFGALANVRFAGPVMLSVEYQPADELTAIRQDLEFLKKHRAAAYGGVRSPPCPRLISSCL